MENYVILILGMFVTGFIDAIAGGGGLISIPVFMLTGLPIKGAIATNKLAAFFGNSVTAYNYYKKGQVDKYILKTCGLLALGGAFLGVYSLKFISSDFLHVLLPVVLLVVIFYTLLDKNIGMKNKFKGYSKKNIFLGRVMSLFIGFYNGFFGPATGTMMALGLISIFKFDFLKATGTTKPLNLLMTIAGLIGFLMIGGINFKYGILASIFRGVGGKVGSSIAIKKGNRIIRPIFLISMVSVMITMVYKI